MTAGDLQFKIRVPGHFSDIVTLKGGLRNKSMMEVSMAGPEEWAYSRVKQASQATLKNWTSV